MTDLDWQRAIDASPTPETRLVYADWLDDQGMPYHAAAQRLCAAGRLEVSGTKWHMKYRFLPEEVRVRLGFFFDPVNPGLRPEGLGEEDLRNFSYYFVRRGDGEHVMLDIVYDMAKSGVDTQAVVSRALGRKD